jgi:septum formation protein
MLQVPSTVLSQRDVVLASETESRRKLLTAAGLAFRIVEPDVDEAAIHDALLKDNGETDPGDVAELLARAKAQEVGARCGSRPRQRCREPAGACRRDLSCS